MQFDRYLQLGQNKMTQGHPCPFDLVQQACSTVGRYHHNPFKVTCFITCKINDDLIEADTNGMLCITYYGLD